MQRLTTLLFLLCLAVGTEAQRLRTYDAPKGAPVSHDYDVMVRTGVGEWQHVPVYPWNVDRVDNGRHHVEQSNVASFDFEGRVEVRVVSHRGSINSHRIRPLSYQIASTQEDSAVVFTIDKPSYLSVEINGDIFHNLQLFANPMIEKVKRKRGMLYFGPGYYDLGEDSIAPKSGQTVYIDGGAYIKGFISAYGVRDVKIIGHGIVNPQRQQEGIMVRYCRNVHIDGPLTTQMPVGGSDSVSISNAKVISWYGWGDGMNVFASNNVSYRNVFCRTSDDCSTIYCTRKGYHGSCRNISVDHAVYWADVAHPIMIGLHGDVEKNETIERVVYNDVDILDQAEHQIDYQGCIAINNGDNITVSNLTFSNFRIESLRYGMLFNLRVCFNKKYCLAPGKGIRNVLFRNISYRGVTPNMSLITGYDSTRTISGIRFENLSINGVRIFDDMPLKPIWYKTSDFANIFVGEHVDNVTFE